MSRYQCPPIRATAVMLSRLSKPSVPWMRSTCPYAAKLEALENQNLLITPGPHAVAEDPRPWFQRDVA